MLHSVTILRLYTAAASNSILLAASMLLAFKRFMPVKLISVPYAGSAVLLLFRFITLAFTVCCLALALSSSALYILCCTFFIQEEMLHYLSVNDKQVKVL